MDRKISIDLVTIRNTYINPACAFSMKIQPEKTKISQAIPHLSA